MTVLSITNESQAHTSGVHMESVVDKLDGEYVDSGRDLVKRLKKLRKHGSSDVTLTFWRTAMVSDEEVGPAVVDSVQPFLGFPEAHRGHNRGD